MDRIFALAMWGATSVDAMAVDSAMLILRLAVGMFFACSGYHKLFNRQRHASLVATLKEDKVPFVGFNQWWVPCCEFAGGTCVLLGVAAPLMAGVLFVLMLVACACEAPKRVASFQPIDSADRLDDYLYLPEVLYSVMLAAIILIGPGRFSIIFH